MTHSEFAAAGGRAGVDSPYCANIVHDCIYAGQIVPRQDSNLYETVGVAAVSYVQFWYFDLAVSLVYQPEDSSRATRWLGCNFIHDQNEHC